MGYLPFFLGSKKNVIVFSEGNMANIPDTCQDSPSFDFVGLVSQI